MLSVCLYAVAQDEPQVHAHRGFRGLMAENTIRAMKNALDQRASVLEMDVCFSKNKKAVVSHDPWLKSEITLDKNGEAIAEGKGLVLYQMKYAKIKKYDVGTKSNTMFPHQKNFKAHIPLLSHLIDSVEHYAYSQNYAKPRYNIEIKTASDRDGVFNPGPEEFAKRLMKVLLKKKIQDRIIIQSFDPRALEVMHSKYPSIPLMLLTTKGTLQENLAKLSFVPNYYCPSVKLIDRQLVKDCSLLGIRLIGGCVNSKKQIDRILRLGALGFISDYPYNYIK